MNIRTVRAETPSVERGPVARGASCATLSPYNMPELDGRYGRHRLAWSYRQISAQPLLLQASLQRKGSYYSSFPVITYALPRVLSTPSSEFMPGVLLP